MQMFHTILMASGVRSPPARWDSAPRTTQFAPIVSITSHSKYRQSTSHRICLLNGLLYERMKRADGPSSPGLTGFVLIVMMMTTDRFLLSRLQSTRGRTLQSTLTWLRWTNQSCLVHCFFLVVVGTQLFVVVQ